MFGCNQILQVDNLPDFRLSSNSKRPFRSDDNAVTHNRYYYQSKMTVVTK